MNPKSLLAKTKFNPKGPNLHSWWFGVWGASNMTHEAQTCQLVLRTEQKIDILHQ